MLSMILTHKYVITGLDKMTLKFQKIFSYYLYSKTNFLFEIYSKFAKEWCVINKNILKYKNDCHFVIKLSISHMYYVIIRIISKPINDWHTPYMMKY